MDTRYIPIVTHRRLYEKDSESMNWLPYISLMAKRPNALKYTGFYEGLPEVWQNYLSDLPQEKKREALITLNTILQKHDIAAAADALEIALNNGVKDSDSILASYYRLTKEVYQMQPMQIKNPYISMPSFQTDNARYDSLFSQEASK
jgi:hypothetical protein